MKKTFCVGALGYGLLEILWRGYTHPSMLFCGGAGLCAIRTLCRKKKTALRLAAEAATVITGLELVTGLIFNRDGRIWDYSDKRGNLWGQICPQYCAIWFLLSLPFVLYFKRK